MISSPSNQTVICFGEVLWDILPQGRMIGGAPLNVSYHLHKLGISTALVSRIGADDYGKDIKAFMEESGLHHAVLQADGSHPTGRVEVIIEPDHEIKYDIVRNTAWDFIEFDEEVKRLSGKAGHLVYGSLACRNGVSRDTLTKMMDNPLVKIMDVNLRAPFYSKELLLELITKADILKINEAELGLIAEWFGCSGNDHEKMKALREQFNLGTLLVTCGSKGAYLLYENDFFFEPGYKIEVVDTIGSGDAFLAGFLSGYIAGKLPRQALKIANGMGAFIAQRRGGCPVYEKQEIQKMINSTFPTF